MSDPDGFKKAGPPPLPYHAPVAPFRYQAATPFRDELHKGMARVVIMLVVLGVIVAVVLGMCFVGVVASHSKVKPSSPGKVQSR